LNSTFPGTPSTPNTGSILYEVLLERHRQEELCRQGKFPATLAHKGELTASECLAVLAEEFGEVAEVVADCIADGYLDRDHLREELIQVAACCVAWVEQLSNAPTSDRPSAAPSRPITPDTDDFLA
jgi:NTP pyrophosphatase (non-canonical NTP hydrolase)